MQLNYECKSCRCVFFVISLMLCLTPFFMIVTEVGAAESNPFDLAMSRQKYVILGDSAKAVLGVELMIGVYPDEATMEAFNKLTIIDQDSRPEKLIVDEFEDIVQGNKKGVFARYKDENAIEYANEIFSDFEYTTRYHRENIKNIKFLTKSRFGSLVRIRYKRIAKNPKEFSPPWAAYLEKKDDGWVFLGALPESNVFQVVSESFPYWTAKEERIFDVDLNLLKVNVYPDNGLDDDPGQASYVTVFYRPSLFETPVKVFNYIDNIKANTIQTLDNRQKVLINSMYHILSVYRKGDPEEILKLWTEDCREEVEFNVVDNPSPEFKRQVNYFRDNDDFVLLYEIYINDVTWLFFAPVKAKKASAPKMFYLQEVNGKYMLSKPELYAVANSIFLTKSMNKMLSIQALRIVDSMVVDDEN